MSCWWAGAYYLCNVKSPLAQAKGDTCFTAATFQVMPPNPTSDWIQLRVNIKEKSMSDVRS